MSVAEGCTDDCCCTEADVFRGDAIMVPPVQKMYGTIEDYDGHQVGQYGDFWREHWGEGIKEEAVQDKLIKTF
jgi:hypothetical protein